MKTAFARMNPNSDNMVVEHNLDKFEVLCVECSWEGNGKLPDAPWLVFLGHKCRLVTESVSTSD